MSIFKTVTLTWAGKGYAIPPTQVLRAIAIIESTITLHELMQYQARGTAPISKVAIAYANVLRFAGASVTDDEVYARLFVGGDETERASTAISALLLMMVPPNAGSGSAEGNVQAADAKLSKKRSKPSSVAQVG